MLTNPTKRQWRYRKGGYGYANPARVGSHLPSDPRAVLGADVRGIRPITHVAVISTGGSLRLRRRRHLYTPCANVWFTRFIDNTERRLDQTLALTLFNTLAGGHWCPLLAIKRSGESHGLIGPHAIQQSWVNGSTTVRLSQAYGTADACHAPIAVQLL